MNLNARASCSGMTWRVMALACALATAVWLQSLCWQEELHYLTERGTLLGVAFADGRMVFTRQTGIMEPRHRRHLNSLHRFTAAPWRGTGVDAANYNLWGKGVEAHAVYSDVDQVKYDRIKSRWNAGELAWESGGRVLSGIADNWELPDPRKRAPAVPIIAPGWLPAAPMAKPGDQLIDPWLFLTIPIWLLAVLASPGALRLLRCSFLRRRSLMRARRGCCDRCGYDLRGSQRCCPECGVPIVALTNQRGRTGRKGREVLRSR